MPLVKTVLKTQIKLAAAAQENSVEAAQDKFADMLATAIDAYIKSGTVNTVLTVATPAGAGSGTGVGSVT